MKRSAASSVADHENFAQEVDRRVAESTAKLAATIQQLQREVADLKRAKVSLRSAERNSSLQINSIPTFISVSKPDGTILSVNQAALDYHGITFEDVQKEDFRTRYFHPNDAERLREERKEALNRPLPFEYEVRALGKDGTYRWFLVHCNPLLDAQGRIDRWYATAFDIEDRKATEEALRKSERQFRLLVETIPALVWRSTPEGDLDYLNRRAVEYLGHTAESLAGGRWLELVHPDHRDRTLQRWLQSATTGTAYEDQYRLRRADGQYRWIQSVGEPFLDTEGRIANWYGLVFDIEDRKRAEVEVQKSEAKLRQVIDCIPTLAWCNLPDGPNEFLNKGWHEYTGLSPEQSHGWGWQAAFHPDDLPPLMERWMKMLLSGEPDEIEARLRRHDGLFRWFLIRAEPFRDESGEIVRWYGTSTDIDDRKRAEAQLAGEKRLLEMVASGHPLPEVLTELCKFVEATGECKCGVYLIDWRSATFRVGAAPSLPATFNDPVEGLTVTSDAGPCGVAALTNAQVLVTDIDSDPRFQSATIRPLLLSHGLRSHWSTPIYSRDGEVLGTFAIFQDHPASATQVQPDLISQVTHIASIAIERALSEAALRQSGTFLAEAQRLSRIGSFSWRVGPDQITWSEELYRIYEFDWGVPVTLDLIRTRVHPEDLTLYEKMVEQARNGADDFEWQYRLLMPDQSIKYMHAVARATRSDDGQLEYIAAVQDITRRKLIEEELRRSEAFLAEGQHLARMGNFWWRVITDQIVWSEPMYRIFDFEPGTTVTIELIASRVHRDDLATLYDMIERAHRGEDFEYEQRIVMPDSSIKYLHVIAHRTAGQYRGPEYIGAVQDVTQRRLSEEALSKARSELAHVSRVMSLGALTASIAHEVNQPLSGIITNASTCVRMLDADPPNVDGARETAKRTIRDGRRAADVIIRLRALFARKDSVTQLVDLNEATLEVIALSHSELERNRVITKTELADQLPLITGDRVQLQQVIMNLLLNGSDAMAEIEDRPRELLFKTEIEEGGRVRLSVQDAGIGIAPESLEQLFHSFYTTKEDGMGIGLSVSRSIIENHRGRLWATPNAGPGVTFSFSIPSAVDSPREIVTPS
jgi:PAS domain S-box-containing protein